MCIFINIYRKCLIRNNGKPETKYNTPIKKNINPICYEDVSNYNENTLKNFSDREWIYLLNKNILGREFIRLINIRLDLRNT
jgi:hypothetical protein